MPYNQRGISRYIRIYSLHATHHLSSFSSSLFRASLGSSSSSCQVNNNSTSFKRFERHFMNTKLQFLLLSSVYRSKFKINFFVHSTPHEFDIASCAVGGGAMASGCSNCWYRMCLTSTLHDGGNSSHSFLYCHFLYRAIREMLTKKVTPKKKNRWWWGNGGSKYLKWYVGVCSFANITYSKICYN